MPVSLKVYNDALEVDGTASSVKFVGKRNNTTDAVTFRVNFDLRAWNADAAVDPSFVNSTSYLANGNKGTVTVPAGEENFSVDVMLKTIGTRAADTRLIVTVWNYNAGNGPIKTSHGRSADVKVLAVPVTPPEHEVRPDNQPAK